MDEGMTGFLIGAGFVLLIVFVIFLARVDAARAYPYGDQNCVIQHNKVLRCYLAEAE